MCAGALLLWGQLQEVAWEMGHCLMYIQLEVIHIDQGLIASTVLVIITVLVLNIAIV